MCIDCINSVFQVILYLLGIILLIALIVFVIKGIKTLSKVDKVIADVDSKSQKLNGVFDIIDHTTDAIASVSDKAVELIFTGIQGIFSRKKKNKEEEIDNE